MKAKKYLEERNDGYLGGILSEWLFKMQDHWMPTFFEHESVSIAIPSLVLLRCKSLMILSSALETRAIMPLMLKIYRACPAPLLQIP